MNARRPLAGTPISQAQFQAINLSHFPTVKQFGAVTDTQYFNRLSKSVVVSPSHANFRAKLE